MRHLASRSFWAAYIKLPPNIRALAEKNYNLLKNDAQHPSLQFKKIGRFWSVRIGLHYRALATETDGGDLVWFWIGTHAVYDSMIG